MDTSDPNQTHTHHLYFSGRMIRIVIATYLMLAHGAVIVAIYYASQHHFYCIKKVEDNIKFANASDRINEIDGEIRANRISLVHDNGRKGVEIGTNSAGESFIYINDKDGVKRVGIFTRDDNSMMEFYSASGMRRMVIGEYPSEQNMSAINIIGSRGLISMGVNDDNVAVSFIDDQNDLLGFLGFRSNRNPYLMLNDKTEILHLEANISKFPNLGLRSRGTLPVKHTRNNNLPTIDQIHKEMNLRSRLN